MQSINAAGIPRALLVLDKQWNVTKEDDTIVVDWIAPPTEVLAGVRDLQNASALLAELFETGKTLADVDPLWREIDDKHEIYQNIFRHGAGKSPYVLLAKNGYFPRLRAERDGNTYTQTYEPFDENGYYFHDGYGTYLVDLDDPADHEVVVQRAMLRCLGSYIPDIWKHEKEEKMKQKVLDLFEFGKAHSMGTLREPGRIKSINDWTEGYKMIISRDANAIKAMAEESGEDFIPNLKSPRPPHHHFMLRLTF